MTNFLPKTEYPADAHSPHRQTHIFTAEQPDILKKATVPPTPQSLQLESCKPYRLIIYLTGTVALAETLIMIILYRIEWVSLWMEIAIDVFFISAVTNALVYFLFLKPLVHRISTQHLAEQKLIASETEYRTLVGNIPGMVYRANPDWTTRIVSGSQDVCGYSTEELNAGVVNWADIIYPEDIPKVFEESQILRSVPTKMVQTYRIIGRENRVRWIDDHKVSLFSEDGKFLGVDGVVFDITERENSRLSLAQAMDNLEIMVGERTADLETANRQLQHKNEELNEFTYVASHDLQEPLRKIISFSDLLVKDIGAKLDPTAQTDLNYIVDAADRMRDLIEHLLLLSRAGSKALKSEKVPLTRCALAAIEALQLRITETDAQITFDKLPEIMGDSTLLTQLYQNLLGNALKYRSSERPSVHFTAETIDGKVVLGVKDNGIGIAPENHTKLFTPFKRLHGRGKYEGTGIGLAICRKVVERHGGRIWIESDLEKGTHFRFTLGQKSPVGTRE